MDELFADVYRDRRVLVTGDTGFKGSWLVLWLQELGAHVYGYALEPPTSPSHFQLLESSHRSEIGDIRDAQHLTGYLEEVEPEIVFHLAAQPLVRASYRLPVDTWTTNVMGSLHLFEACRKVESVCAIVAITTDKVYENREWIWGYREHEALGGHDPYSASKASADVLATSYRSSFWPGSDYGRTHRTLLAIARAGNVIGGGDWAEDRLIPDLVRGITAGEEAVVRNPCATRPWQHVLEPLSGYLLLGQKLLEGRRDLARAWNFGPAPGSVQPVGELVARFAELWPALRYRIDPPPEAPHEAGALTLDSSLARTLLGWEPVWDGEPCLEQTARWYRQYYEDRETTSRSQLEDYIRDGAAQGAVWAAGGERTRCSAF